MTIILKNLLGCASAPKYTSVEHDGDKIVVEKGIHFVTAMKMYKKMKAGDIVAAKNSTLITPNSVKRKFARWILVGVPPVVRHSVSCPGVVMYEVKFYDPNNCDTLTFCVEYLGFKDVVVHNSQQLSIFQCK